MLERETKRNSICTELLPCALSCDRYYEKVEEKV